MRDSLYRFTRHSRFILRSIGASAHSCPFKRGVKGPRVLTREPIPPLRRSLIDAEREGRIGMSELFNDVDGIIPRRCSEAGIGPSQRMRRHAPAYRLNT
jgi:hypothetical protein